MHPDAENGAHGGLDGLGVVAFDGVGRSEDLADAEPVGNAEDRAQITGVADPVEGENEFVGIDDGFDRRGTTNDGERRRRMRQLTDPPHRLFPDIFHPIMSDDVETRAQRLLDQLLPLHDKQSPLLAELLLSQRPNLLDLVLRKHL